MNIYLLRHGDALPVGAGGITNDDQRSLSDGGREEIRQVAAGLRKLKVVPDTLLSSPLLRAQQTADIVAQAFDRLAVTSCEELGHGFSCPALLARLRELPSKASVVLVGHQPDLGMFASFLLVGDDSVEVALKKGGLCWIEFEKAPAAGQGTIRWLLTQKQLSMMAA